MTIDIVFIAALSIVGIIGSVLAVARDGYRRIPTRQF